MSNMSYCRFQNTLHDLVDCEQAIEDLLAGDEELSNEELAAAKQLVESCFNIVSMIADHACKEAHEIIDGNTEREIRMVLDSANINAINAGSNQ